jgi:hypothetical protein
MISQSVIGSGAQAESSATSGSMPPLLNVIILTKEEEKAQ